MAQLVTRGRVAALTVLCTLWSLRAAAQQRDTTAPRPVRPDDSLKVYTLPPAVVSVTRANPPSTASPKPSSSSRRPTSAAPGHLGLDEGS